MSSALVRTQINDVDILLNKARIRLNNTSRTNIIVRKPETACRSKENRSIMTTVRSIPYVYQGRT